MGSFNWTYVQFFLDIWTVLGGCMINIGNDQILTDSVYGEF